MLLSSLPKSLSTTVDVIGGKEDLTFEEVRDRVLNEDIRRRERNETSGSTGLALNIEGRGCGGQRNNNHGRSKSRGRNELECWGCGRKGHMKRDCEFRRRERMEEANSADVATEEDSDEAFVLCIDSCIESWILDSCALSFHSTSQKDKFFNFKSGNLGEFT